MCSFFFRRKFGNPLGQKQNKKNESNQNFWRGKNKKVTPCGGGLAGGRRKCVEKKQNVSLKNDVNFRCLQNVLSSAWTSLYRGSILWYVGLVFRYIASGFAMCRIFCISDVAIYRRSTYEEKSIRYAKLSIAVSRTLNLSEPSEISSTIPQTSIPGTNGKEGGCITWKPPPCSTWQHFRKWDVI